MDPFRYTIADLYDNFKFGSPSLWNLCNKIAKDKNHCDFDNDPLLTKARRKKLTKADRMDSVLNVVEKDGMFLATRDIVLGQNPAQCR